MKNTQHGDGLPVKTFCYELYLIKGMSFLILKSDFTI